MPNAPKTPLRNVRVADELWGLVKAKAEAERRTASDVVRQILREFFLPPDAK